MPSSLTIRQARLVLPDREAIGDLVVEDGVITEVAPRASRPVGEEIDGTGLVALPGVIDPQVHFRDPGFPWKEDLATGSRAAAAGGVTAFLEMPNTDPPTISVAALADKLALAAQKSIVHYGFFIGTNGDNIDELQAADRSCGVKIFMGSSTGPLLVADRDRLEAIFAAVDRPIAVHAEDEARLRERKAQFGADVTVADHPKIRDEQTALIATRTAIELALKYGRKLHILHVSTAEEADLLASIPRGRITAETCPQYLFLSADDYERLGTRAQCNPPIRDKRHRAALWKHLLAGTFDCLATDHAPHTLEEKAKPYPNSPSGMPGVEWLLPLMCDQVANGTVTWRQVVTWLCEGPARAHQIVRKGRLQVGYDGDLVLIDPARTKVIEDGAVLTKVGWSPFAGRSVTGWPVLTAVLGRPVFRDGAIVEGGTGRPLSFGRA